MQNENLRDCLHGIATATCENNACHFHCRTQQPLTITAHSAYPACISTDLLCTIVSVRGLLTVHKLKPDRQMCNKHSIRRIAAVTRTSCVSRRFSVWQADRLAQRVSDLTADRERATQLEADMKKAKVVHDKTLKETLAGHEQTLEQTLADNQRAFREARTSHEQAVQVIPDNIWEQHRSHAVSNSSLLVRVCLLHPCQRQLAASIFCVGWIREAAERNCSDETVSCLSSQNDKACMPFLPDCCTYFCCLHCITLAEHLTVSMLKQQRRICTEAYTQQTSTHIMHAFTFDTIVMHRCASLRREACVAEHVTAQLGNAGIER